MSEHRSSRCLRDWNGALAVAAGLLGELLALIHEMRRAPHTCLYTNASTPPSCIQHGPVGLQRKGTLMRRLTAAACALIIVLLAAAQPAHAVTWYCQDQVQPVTLTVTWVTGYRQVDAKTSAPINSTAKLYAKLAGASSFSYVGYAHDPAGTTVTIGLVTQTPGSYVIVNYADTGQTWHDSNGATLAYCRSPIRTLI